jgi:O-antigen/teichoic acid export membrane protein
VQNRKDSPPGPRTSKEDGTSFSSPTACAAFELAPTSIGTSSTIPPLLKRSSAFLLVPTHTHTLRANFVWNAVGITVFSLSQWGILAAFAKLGTPALVGQIVYGLALTTPLFVVASLQLRQIQATDSENRHRLSQYLGLKLLATSAAIIVALLMAGIAWTSGAQLSMIVVLWALSKTFDAGSDALYGLFQQSERMDYVGLSYILRGVLAFASVVVLLRASHSALIALAGIAVSWCAVFILFDIPMARLLIHNRKRSTRSLNTSSESLRPVLDRRQLVSLFLESAPLGVVAFLFAVQAQIPRYVIAGLLHTRELGLFSAAAYLTFVGTTLVNALGAPASVRLAQYYVAGARSSFRQLMTKLLLVASALGTASILVSLFAGSRILTLLYTNEYSQMASVLTMLCASSALSYIASFFGYGMTSLRRYKIQVPVFVAVVLITLVSCYWLTGRYGMMGTAAGILVGNLGQLLMSAAVVLRAKWPDRDLLRADLRISTT